MKIVRIVEDENTRTIEICLSDECSDDERHKQEFHRSYTWSTAPIKVVRPDGKEEEFVMSLEAMAWEALLLAREEERRMEQQQIRELPGEEIERLNKLIAEQIEKDALRIQTDNTLKHTEILTQEGKS